MRGVCLAQVDDAGVLYLLIAGVQVDRVDSAVTSCIHVQFVDR